MFDKLYAYISEMVSIGYTIAELVDKVEKDSSFTEAEKTHLSWLYDEYEEEVLSNL